MDAGNGDALPYAIVGGLPRWASGEATGAPEFCLTTQHLPGGGGGGGDGGGLTPPPPLGPPHPLLSDWANFSPVLRPIKNFL